MTVHDWRAALRRLEGAYSDNTIRTYRSDVQAYEAWCLEQGIDLFPASSEMIADFITARAPFDAASTLRRRLYGIRKIHRLLRLPSLVDDEDVAIALRRALRQKRSRVKQALGLKRDLLERLMAATDNDLLGLRDRALLALGYATLCRRAELVAIRVEDFGRVDEDGSVSVLIRRSKADPFGYGRIAWVPPDAMRHVRAWLDTSGIEQGYVLRSIFGGRIVDEAVAPYSVSRRLKRLAEKAGLDAQTVRNLSGHSMRVGAAQDMAEEGFDLLALMTAGGWKTAQVVARYVEEARVRRVGERRSKQDHHSSETELQQT
jgi:integrase/recombinase XerD